MYEDWDTDWAAAYSDGHNKRGLRGRRLAHYAHAFADIRAEVDSLLPDLEVTLEAFWLRWDRGGAFEGDTSGHWHLAIA